MLYIDGLNLKDLGVTLAPGALAKIMTPPQFKAQEQTDWAECDGVEVDLSEPVFALRTISIPMTATEPDALALIEEMFIEPGGVLNFYVQPLSYEFNARIVNVSNVKIVGHITTFTLTVQEDTPQMEIFRPQTVYCKPARLDVLQIDDIDIGHLGMSLLEGSADNFNDKPTIKEALTINESTQPGVVYDVDAPVRYDERRIVAKLHFRASDETDFANRYCTLMAALTSVGLHRVRCDMVGLLNYSCYYDSLVFDELTPLKDGTFWVNCTLSMNIAEERDDKSNYVYGVEWDFRSGGQSATRIGNKMLHRILPVQSRMRGCLLDDNGSVTEYLPLSSWQTATRDGSRGQVMVEVMEFWMRFTSEGNINRVELSEVAQPGFAHIKRFYVSAYPAAIQRSTLKLSSVRNTTPDYRGGSNTSSYDGTYRTLLGRPATYISRKNFRTYARNRGSISWNIMTYELCKTLYWLMVVEYANINPKTEYNPVLTPEGYRQGGLGAGMNKGGSGMSHSSFNSNNPFVPCGYTDEFGNRTGVKSFSISDSSKTYQFNIHRYRGIELPWGQSYTILDGINVQVTSSKIGVPWVCSDPAKFADETTVGYEARSMLTGASWTPRILFGEHGDIFCTYTGGSSSTFYAAYYECIISSSTAASIVRMAIAGDPIGSTGNMISLNCGQGYTTASNQFGTRLTYIPL